LISTKLADICRHSPLLCHGAWTAIWLSVLVHEHTIAYHDFFTVIVAIIVILASAGWPHEDTVTCILNPTIDLWRIWYALVETQMQGSSRSCKTPHSHHHLTSQHHLFVPPGTFSCQNSPFLEGTRGIVLLSSRVWKDVNGWALEIGISCTYSNPVVTGGRKHTHTVERNNPPLCLSTTTNGQTNEHDLYFFCHPRAARSRNGFPSWYWLSFETKLLNTVFPTGALEVSCSVRTWFKGNCAKFPSQPYSPCLPNQSAWFIRPLTHSILLTTTASTAPGLIFQEQIFQHTNSICHSQSTAYLLDLPK
jgi:hypothetical protein